MKTKYIMGALLAASLAFTSCEKMLDIDQHGVSSLETYYKTDAEAEEALTAVYAAYSGVFYDNYFLNNMLADDFWSGGGDRGDNASNEQLNEFVYGANHASISSLFSNYYKAIYRANVVLGHVDESSAIKQRARAEAKVIRALCYIDLISLWGTPPLVDHELTPDEYKAPNGNPNELWALVESDLNEAIASGYLPQKSSLNDKETGYHTTKQLAQALLGKAYVFQKEWTAAIASFDQVIGSGLYDLYEGEYENVLSATADNSRESMFELNKLNDVNNVWSNFSFYPVMVGWRGSKMSFGKTSDVYASCWGFCNPRKGLYDAFVAWEGAEGYRLNQTMKTYDQVKAMGDAITAGNALYGHEGYFMWKNRTINSDLISGGFGFCSQKNERIMRYAEVLLLAAEAQVMGGGTKATEYINKIRTRAKLPALASVDMNVVKTEKRLELCGESVRFQDLVRWGDAFDALNAVGKDVPNFKSDGTVVWNTYNQTQYGFKQGKHELLPFPEAEVSLNDKIVQNQGW